MTGGGSNGKSTLRETWIRVLGVDNCCEMGLDELARAFNVPSLQGKLMVSCTEMIHRDPTALAMLKKIISGDRVSGEIKYQKRLEFSPTCKFVFAMNDVPPLVDKSYGLSRKIIVLQFNQRFAEDNTDTDLRDKLLGELDGIFMWMLQGAVELVQAGRFLECAAITEEKNEFFANANPLAMFVRECCDVGPGLRLPSKALYEAYVKWCLDGNLKPLGKINFNQALPHILPGSRRAKLRFGEDGSRDGYDGIALKAD